ncbi:MULTISPECIES: hypothetical protein [Amniculibacterium]|jgi:hypothetical protein|uniref:hypothetical protein n=1 Tax=Amniculibacterium TaxID=2715289 RepID=UPI000F595562|nr:MULTISPECIES: hypothetical protein [Amniculibacterium]
MKKAKLIAAGLVMGLIVFSCNKTENHAGHETHETHDNHATDEKEAGIELNNGEKWKVNEEMKPFILESETIVNDFVSQNKNDYKMLAKEITIKNDELINSCTMDGKSHDELHKWLAPHLELVEKLGASDDAEAKELVSKLADSYKTYHEYFQ